MTLVYLLKVYIIVKLHVFCMDSEDLETTSGIRDADVDFTIETTKTTKCWVDRIGSICSGHYDNVGSRLKTIHQGEQLRDNATFDFTVGLTNVSVSDR